MKGGAAAGRLKCLIVGNLVFNPQVARWVDRLFPRFRLGAVHFGRREDLSEVLLSKLEYVHCVNLAGVPWLFRPVQAFVAGLRARWKWRPRGAWVIGIWWPAVPFWLGLGAFGNARLVQSVNGSDFNQRVGSFVSRAWMRVLIRSARVVLTTTPEMARSVATVSSPRRMTAIHWGVNTRIFHPVAPAERARFRGEWLAPASGLLICSARFFRPISPYRTILQTLAQLKAADISWRLVILLTGANEASVRDGLDLITALGLTGQVTLVPETLSMPQLAQLYNAADMVLDLLTMDQLGSTILEAAACGPAVITSDLAQYRRLREEGVDIECIPLAHLEERLVGAISRQVAAGARQVNETSLGVLRRLYEADYNQELVLGEIEEALTS